MQRFGKQVEVNASRTPYDEFRALVDVFFELVSKFLQRPDWQTPLRFALHGPKLVKVMHRSVLGFSCPLLKAVSSFLTLTFTPIDEGLGNWPT